MLNVSQATLFDRFESEKDIIFYYYLNELKNAESDAESHFYEALQYEKNLNQDFLKNVIKEELKRLEKAQPYFSKLLASLRLLEADVIASASYAKLLNMVTIHLRELPRCVDFIVNDVENGVVRFNETAFSTKLSQYKNNFIEKIKDSDLNTIPLLLLDHQKKFHHYKIDDQETSVKICFGFLVTGLYLLAGGITLSFIPVPPALPVACMVFGGLSIFTAFVISNAAGDTIKRFSAIKKIDQAKKDLNNESASLETTLTGTTCKI